MNDLTGKNAVVVGAVTGIGRALVDKCCEEGMGVGIVDIDAEGAAELEAALLADGHLATATRADVASFAEMQQAAEHTREVLGSVDLLFLNAGIQRVGQFLDVPVEDHERTIDVDLKGVLFGLKAFLPAMIETGEPAHITTTASASALGTYQNLSSYNAAKAGVLNLVETVHHELRDADANISMSILCPGAVNTELYDWNRYLEDPSSSHYPEAEFMHSITEKGSDPSEIADFVFEGIKAGKYWLFPHEAVRAMFQKRVDAMMRDETPTLKRLLNLPPG